MRALSFIQGRQVPETLMSELVKDAEQFLSV